MKPYEKTINARLRQLVGVKPTTKKNAFKSK